MSRRSLYKPGRANTSLYGPKTDTTIVHWTYDWLELATTRDEETEGIHNVNTFKVKTWQKSKQDLWQPIDDGVEGDELVLFNQMQTTVDEIARQDANNANTPSERATPEVKLGSGLQSIERTPEPTEKDAMEVDEVNEETNANDTSVPTPTGTE